MKNHLDEVSSGERFKFGENWSRFLTTLDDTRIQKSTNALKEWLGLETLDGMSFVDVGSGSGLSSLAAYRLGAKVYSFDYDPKSVACTQHLRDTYAKDTERWSVSSGSALDKDFLATLGQFDIVYSWGVLHHTGAMWQALDNMVPMVTSRGLLFIAIYNDQGPWSRRWKSLKCMYNKLPSLLATVFAILVMGAREVRFAASAILKLNLMKYVRTWTNYGSAGSRGMSKYYDLVDWIGGYPFEVAKPEEIFDFYHQRCFSLERLETCRGGLGCNQFVFRRVE